MEMGLVRGLVFVCLFLIGLCAIEHYFRFSRLPYISWIVLFGIAYGMLNQWDIINLPSLTMTPDVILYIFLPILIFDSSRKLDLKMSRKEALPATLLATLGILASMFIMALLLKLITDLKWIDILFFTAIMSATDPVAVGAVFKQFPIPERLKTLIEGESLLNDGTTVILFLLLSGKILESKDMFLYKEIGLFILSIAGALLLGALTGWIGAWLMHRWKALKDHFVGTLLPLLIVYLTFCIAQAMLEISGVIAVMATTLMFRTLYRRFKEEDIPTQAETDSRKGSWEILGALANAVLFFILGVEIGSHTGEITWILMPGFIAALLITRSAVVYGFGFAFRIFRIRLPWSWQHTLNLGGLKGALSVALILMIPKEYPYRDYFLFAALAMVLFTLIGNTLAMRLYLAKVKIDSE